MGLDHADQLCSATLTRPWPSTRPSTPTAAPRRRSRLRSSAPPPPQVAWAIRDRHDHACGRARLGRRGEPRRPSALVLDNGGVASFAAAAATTAAAARGRGTCDRGCARSARAGALLRWPRKHAGRRLPPPADGRARLCAARRRHRHLLPRPRARRAGDRGGVGAQGLARAVGALLSALTAAQSEDAFRCRLIVMPSGPKDREEVWWKRLMHGSGTSRKRRGGNNLHHHPREPAVSAWSQTKQRREGGRRNPHPKTCMQYIMIENKEASKKWPIPVPLKKSSYRGCDKRGRTAKKKHRRVSKSAYHLRTIRCGGYKQTNNTTYLYTDGSYKDGKASWAVWHSTAPVTI
jgi:hypothetical protein